MNQNQPIQKKKKPLNIPGAILDNMILIAITALLGTALVIGIVIKTHNPYYTVSASLLFEPHIPELVYSSNERYLHSFEDWMRTQSHEIESPWVLTNAIRKFELDGFNWLRDSETEKTAVDRLRGRLDISQINNTQILTLTLGSNELVGLAEIVNSVVQSYIDHKDHQRKDLDQQKLTYLRGEREKYNERIDQAYQDLVDISREYATAVTDEKNLYIYLNMFMDLRSRYNQALTEGIDAESKMSALIGQRDRLLEMDVYDPRNSQVLIELEQEIMSAMVGLQESSPEYARHEANLANLDNASIETARNYWISEINLELNNQTMLHEAAHTSVGELKKQLGYAELELMEFNTAILTTNTQRQEIDRLTNIWNRINERIEQIEIELFNPGQVKILSAAQTPEFPDPNKMMKKVILGIVVIFGLSFGLAIGKEFLDPRIKRKQDLESSLGFPVGAVIPNCESEGIAKSKLQNLPCHHPNSYIVESFRQLAVRLEQDHEKHGSSVYSVHSMAGGSGSTAIVKNILSILDVPANRKLLLDLSNSSIAADTAMDSSDGVNPKNFISNPESIENYIIQSEEGAYSEVKFDSTGNINRKQLRDLFEYLKTKFDYVLVDTSAFLFSSFSQAVSQRSDMSLVIVNSQKDTYTQLYHGLDLLKSLNVDSLTIIQNNISAPRFSATHNLINKHNLLNTAKMKKTEMLQQGHNG